MNTPQALRKKKEKPNPVIARGWALYGPIMDYWANEIDCPYTEVKPFTWWRSYQMGGRSILWGRQSYRWSDHDFGANAKDGVAIDWPIRYKDIAPGTIMLRSLPASVAQQKACHNYQMDTSSLQWI